MGAVASEFGRLKHYGSDAYYARDSVFQEKPNLKLITRIREINELFSKALYAYGHTREFEDKGEEDGNGSPVMDESNEPTRDSLYVSAPSFPINNLDTGSLDDTIAEPHSCEPPERCNIIDHIEKEWMSSRGYELGTFGSEMLSSTFKEQSKKWEPMTRAHVSNAILIVHDFIQGILEASCPDPVMRDSIWSFVSDKIHEGYKAAMKHTEFLLNVELEGKKMTYNPKFEEVLMEAKAARLVALTQHSDVVGQQGPNNDKQYEWNGYEYWEVTKAENKKELVQVLSETSRREIHDVLHSYYTIARSRFVDVVCQQVIDHFLLHGPDSPLSVLCDQLVLRMTPAELEDVAGEDLGTRNRRETLTREIDGLTKALKVLKT